MAGVVIVIVVTPSTGFGAYSRVWVLSFQREPSRGERTTAVSRRERRVKSGVHATFTPRRARDTANEPGDDEDNPRCIQLSAAWDRSSAIPPRVSHPQQPLLEMRSTNATFMRKTEIRLGLRMPSPLRIALAE
jgi:hypothetical protein